METPNWEFMHRINSVFQAEIVPHWDEDRCGAAALFLSRDPKAKSARLFLLLFAGEVRRKWLWDTGFGKDVVGHK